MSRLMLSLQCGACVHLRGVVSAPIPSNGLIPLPRGRCAAYPEGIPRGIWDVRIDHRRPHPGDHGIQFQALPGLTHPGRPEPEAGARPG